MLTSVKGAKWYCCPDHQAKAWRMGIRTDRDHVSTGAGQRAKRHITKVFGKEIPRYYLSTLYGNKFEKTLQNILSGKVRIVR